MANPLTEVCSEVSPGLLLGCNRVFCEPPAGASNDPSDDAAYDPSFLSDTARSEVGGRWSEFETQRSMVAGQRSITSPPHSCDLRTSTSDLRPPTLTSACDLGYHGESGCACRRRLLGCLAVRVMSDVHPEGDDTDVLFSSGPRVRQIVRSPESHLKSEVPYFQRGAKKF